MKILIIGQGNVATNLQVAFARQGIRVPMLSSWEGLETIDPSADVYIYAVKDIALRQVISKVHVAPRALHIHTSGTMPLSVFGADKQHRGVFYPFQTFSKSHLIEDFSTVPVFIEGNGIDDVSAIYSLAQTITSRIFETTQQERERLHVAGVFACNFANLMYAMASDMLAKTSIPFSVLLPLIEETASKVKSLTPDEAQTGPAVRKDYNVMAHHLDILKREEESAIYGLLSNEIMRRHKADKES